MTRDEIAPRTMTFSPPDGPIRPLTPQQERVVAGLCRGWGTRTIARHLGIAPSTVKGHLTAIDNLFAWRRDDDASPRERIRRWALFRLWERERAMRQLEDQAKDAAQRSA